MRLNGCVISMIINSKTKVDIDQDYKIEAGPGAGKTQFLVNHINNVLQNSDRLSCTRKIACITYTNTAVETILKRLGKGISNKVEVSTTGFGDPGGLIPLAVANRFIQQQPYQMLGRMKNYVKNTRYQNAQIDYIRDPFAKKK